MNFSSAPVPEHPSGPPDAVAITQYRKQMERMNCGFDKVEILSGNIGYVKFDMFAADQTHLNDLWERKSDETRHISIGHCLLFRGSDWMGNQRTY